MKLGIPQKSKLIAQETVCGVQNLRSSKNVAIPFINFGNVMLNFGEREKRLLWQLCLYYSWCNVLLLFADNITR